MINMFVVEIDDSIIDDIDDSSLIDVDLVKEYLGYAIYINGCSEDCNTDICKKCPYITVRKIDEKMEL